MTDGFTRYSPMNEVRIEASPRAISNAAQSALPAREQPPAESAVLGRYVNDRFNSRVSPVLGPARPFRTSWRLDLPLRDTPIAIAQSGDRALVFSMSDWMLCDLAGHMVKRGILQYGEMRLDPGRQLFYAPNFTGLVNAYRLTDGGVGFQAFFDSNADYFRSFIARRDRHMILLSTELHVDMGQPEPHNTILEISDLGDPANQKSFGESGEPMVIADLVRATQTAMVAIHRETIVYATQDRIYGIDMNLVVRQILTGSFSPIAMSLDDLGRIYLLAEEAGRTVLFCVTIGGERLFTYSLAAGLTARYAPVVGYDHTSYLVTPSQIYAVNSDGKERWLKPTAGSCPGAVVTADDVLLASEGAVIGAYHASGERQELARLPEPLAAAPVLFAPGRMLAVSNTALYLLEAAA